MSRLITEKLIKFAPFALGDNLIALAYGRSPKHLPTNGAPWRVVGSLGLGAEVGPRVDASCEEILAAVERQGYFVGRARPSAVNGPQ
jgi:hypothetical protein